MKKKLKIILLVVLSLVVLRIAIFQKFNMYENDISILRQNYGEYIFCVVDDIDLSGKLSRHMQRLIPHLFKGQGYDPSKRNVFILRWKIPGLKKQLKQDFEYKLQKLDQFNDVEYEYDDELLCLDITSNSNGYEGYIYYEDNIEELFGVLGQIYGEPFGSLTFEFKDKERKQYGYDEKELAYLEKILSHSKKKPEGSLERWKNVTWSSYGIKRVEKLDLSGFDDITGTLDLSGFKELSSICLGWMNIEKVILPSSVKEIGDKAFYECTELKEITMPENVETVYTTAFSGCEKLNKLIFMGDRPELEGFTGIFERIPDDVVICYPEDKKGWNVDEYPWNQYKMVAAD